MEAYLIRCCGTCKFWDNEGECRFHPPVIVTARNVRTVNEGVDIVEYEIGTVFPATHANQWCRRWKNDPAHEVYEVVARESVKPEHLSYLRVPPPPPHNVVP